MNTSPKMDLVTLLGYVEAIHTQSKYDTHVTRAYNKKAECRGKETAKMVAARI